MNLNYSMEAAELALSNDLIVINMVKMISSVNDLKTFRLLNKKCSEFARTKMFQLACISNAQLEKICDESGYATVGKLQGKFRALMKLKKVQKSVPVRFASLKTSEFWNYIVYGDVITPASSTECWILPRPEITYLELDQNFQSTAIIVYSLLQMFSQTLEELVIGNGIFQTSSRYLADVGMLSPNLRLEHLKILRVSEIDMTPMFRLLIQDILLAAPNLMIFEGFQIKMLPYVVALEKLYLIKSLTFVMNGQNIPFYEQISDLGVALESIVVSGVEAEGFTVIDQFTSIFANLLYKSRNSLKKLQFRDFRFLGQVQPPTSIMITKLELMVIPTVCTGLQPGQKIADIFPALKTVIIEERDLTDVHGKYLLRCEQFLGVKELEIDVKFLSSIFMERICDKFPNVETVRVIWSSLMKGTHFFWKLPFNTKTIEIYEFSMAKHRNLLLESLLTGIPRKVCVYLQNLAKGCINLPEFAKLPSIRMLENLETLKIQCSDFDDSVAVGEFGFVSHLTKWFVLEKMPALQINLVLPRTLFFGWNSENSAEFNYPKLPPITDDIIFSYVVEDSNNNTPKCFT